MEKKEFTYCFFDNLSNKKYALLVRKLIALISIMILTLNFSFGQVKNEIIPDTLTSEVKDYFRSKHKIPDSIQSISSPSECNIQADPHREPLLQTADMIE